MATTSINLPIPEPVFRLGENVVENLVVTGITKEVTVNDIETVLTNQCKKDKRSVRALIRIVDDESLSNLNKELASLREQVKPEDRMKIRASYSRGLCQVLHYK